MPRTSVGRNIRVHFISSEPSEKEYIHEYDKYNTSMWFILIFILRSMIPFCTGLQVGLFESPYGIDLFMKDFLLPINSSLCRLKHPEGNVTSWKGISHTFETDCTRKNIVMQMVFFASIGGCAGSILGGILADLYGRRIISLCFSFLWNVLGWFLVFAKTTHTTQILYAIITGCSTAVNITTFVTFGEIANKKNRFLTVYTNLSYIIGILFVDHISKLFTCWRYVMFFVCSANFCLIFASWYIPESPRWLMNKNKRFKAYEQLSDISGGRYNFIQEHVEDGREGIIDSEKKEVLTSMFQHLFKKKLMYFLPIGILMACISISYHISKLYTVLHYIHTREFGFLISSAELLSYLFFIPIYLFLGKRNGLFFLTFVAFVQSVLSLIFINVIGEEIYHNIFRIMFATTMADLTKFYILDLFSTFLRATTFGYSYLIDGVATIISCCLITVLRENGFYHYFIVLMLALLSSIVLLLPNTAERDLPNFKLYRRY